MFSSAIIKTELNEHKSWFIGWLIALFSFSLMIIAIYPGDEVMKDLSDFLSDPLYQSFLGDIGGQNPSYASWQSMMIPFLGMIFAIFGILLGVRVSMKSISDRTSEIVSTLPIKRAYYLFNKILAIFLLCIIVLSSWFVPLIIPINGNSLDTGLVWDLLWWSFLFLVMSLMLGILLGNLTGSSSRGAQNGILLILGMFVINIIANIQSANLIKTVLWEYTKDDVLTDYTLLNLIMDINLLNWYAPSNLILGGDIDFKYILLILIAIFIFTSLVFWSYIKKDMIDDRGVISFGFRRKKENIDIESDDQSHVKAKRSVKKSIYTFWVRPLEKKLPFTADIVYSDRSALMILTIATLMIWPLQLMAYPGDVVANSATAFVSGGFLNVFTNGYDIGVHPPWTWWLVTQAIGVHWFLLIPMTLRWVRSVPSRDGEDITGDLVGSLPVRKRDVVFQRLLGVFLELVWITIWVVIWFLLSLTVIESQVGNILTEADPVNGLAEVLFEFNNTMDTTWTIIAIVSLIPLYMFLVTAGVAINLFFKEKGLTFAKIFLYILLLMFIGGFSQPNPDFYWVSGIMGMYNPVGIMIDESFEPGNYGVFVLIALNIISLFIVRWNTRKFSWLKQDKTTLIVDSE